MTRPTSFLLRHLLLAAALLLPACNKSQDPAPNALTLQIISPHSSDIRREFGEAFSNWHQQHFGQPVNVLWPDVGGGGTENIVRQLNAAYQRDTTCGYDIAFGGGSASGIITPAAASGSGSQRS